MTRVRGKRSTTERVKTKALGRVAVVNLPRSTTQHTTSTGSKFERFVYCLVDGTGNVVLFVALVCVAFALMLFATGQWDDLNRSMLSAQNQSSYRIPYEAPTKMGLVFNWLYKVSQPAVKVAIWVLPIIILYIVKTAINKLMKRVINWVQFNTEWSNIQVKLLLALTIWTFVIILIWALLASRLALQYLLAALAGLILNLVFYGLAYIIRPDVSTEAKL